MYMLQKFRGSGSNPGHSPWPRPCSCTVAACTVLPCPLHSIGGDRVERVLWSNDDINCSNKSSMCEERGGFRGSISNFGSYKSVGGVRGVRVREWRGSSIYGASCVRGMKEERRTVWGQHWGERVYWKWRWNVKAGENYGWEGRVQL